MAQARKKASGTNRRKPARSTKRKTTDRPGLPGKFLSEETRLAVKSWLFEVGALISCAASVFLFLALSSYLYSLHTMTAEGGLTEVPSGNWMGPLGNLTAVLMVGFFGWCSYIPVLWFLGLSLWCWRSSDDQNEITVELPSGWLFIPGILGAFFCCTVLSAIYGGRAAGGSFGLEASRVLSGFLNAGGATLVCIVGFLVFSGFTTKKSSWEIFVLTARTLLKTAQLIFVTAPMVIARLFYQGLCFCYDSCADWFSVIYDRVSHWYASIREARAKRKEEKEQEKIAKEREKEVSPVQSNRYEPKVLEEPVPGETVLEKERPDIVIHSSTQKLRRSRRKYVGQKKVTSSSGTAYRFPPLTLLNEAPAPERSTKESEAEFEKLSDTILKKLSDFGIEGSASGVHKGPVITSYEIKPAPGVKVNKIAGLQDDLAMSLKANSVRIIAPIPGKGTVGIEVPNKKRELVCLRDVLESDEYLNAESSLTVAIGKDIYGTPVVADIATMPHLLIAGATGTGKSVCINSLLLSLLYRSTPDDLGLILIDPKILELSVYENIPHLKVPVVTDPKMANAVLLWAVNEMNRRYKLLKRFGVRGIDSYNALMRQEPDKLEEQETIDDLVSTEPDGEEEDVSGPIGEVMEPLPKIVIVIDELADLMLSVGKDIESHIARLAQKARAAGIHLIVATQRPSVDVITGLIKANFPVRISFRVSSKIDSRTILDTMGSEKLLGKGDLLMMAPREVPIQRVHGAFVDDEEVTRVIADIKAQASPQYDEKIIQAIEKALQDDKDSSGASVADDEYDDLYDEAVQFVIDQGKASSSMIQRRFKIGYNRAARIVDIMERDGVVGPQDGARPREILIEGHELDA